MRLDLFLRNVGLVKRRAVAQKACREGAILVDGIAGRPGRSVRKGAKITLHWPHRLLEVEVLALAERPVPREARDNHYRILRDQGVPENEI